MFETLYRAFMFFELCALVSLCAWGISSAYDRRGIRKVASFAFFVSFSAMAWALFCVFVAMIFLGVN